MERNKHEGTLKPIRCHKCGTWTSYCPEHDAFYCKYCDVWSVKRCDDKECAFCRRRPAKPSSVENNSRPSPVSVTWDEITRDEIMGGRRWAGGMEI